MSEFNFESWLNDNEQKDTSEDNGLNFESWLNDGKENSKPSTKEESANSIPPPDSSSSSVERYDNDTASPGKVQLRDINAGNARLQMSAVGNNVENVEMPKHVARAEEIDVDGMKVRADGLEYDGAKTKIGGWVNVETPHGVRTMKLKEVSEGKPILEYDDEEVEKNYKKYGLRNDGKTYKGTGWLGELKTADGGVATEYTSQSDAVRDKNGKMIDFPTLVPTLTKEEVKEMTGDVIPNRKPVPESIMQKAVNHALKMQKEGKSVFANDGVYQGGYGVGITIPGAKFDKMLKDGKIKYDMTAAEQIRLNAEAETGDAKYGKGGSGQAFAVLKRAIDPVLFNVMSINEKSELNNLAELSQGNVGDYNKHNKADSSLTEKDRKEAGRAAEPAITVDPWEEKAFKAGLDGKDAKRAEGEDEDAYHNRVRSTAYNLFRERLGRIKDANKKIGQTEKTALDKIMVGGAESLGYQYGFGIGAQVGKVLGTAVRGTEAIGEIGLPALMSFGERYSELTSDEYQLDDNGKPQLVSKGDSPLKGGFKAAVGAVAESAVEKFGGDFFDKAAGLPFRGAGKWLKSKTWGGPILEFGCNFSNFTKATQLSSPFGEVFEEDIQYAFDDMLGLNKKSGEKNDTIAEAFNNDKNNYGRLSPRGHLDTFLSLIGLIGAQAAVSTGVAVHEAPKMIHDSNELNGLLASAGVSKDNIQRMSKEEREQLKTIWNECAQNPEKARDLLKKTNGFLRTYTNQIVEQMNAKLADDIAKSGATPVQFTIPTEADGKTPKFEECVIQDNITGDVKNAKIATDENSKVAIRDNGDGTFTVINLLRSGVDYDCDNLDSAISLSKSFALSNQRNIIERERKVKLISQIKQEKFNGLDVVIMNNTDELADALANRQDDKPILGLTKNDFSSIPKNIGSITTHNGTVIVFADSLQSPNAVEDNLNERLKDFDQKKIKDRNGSLVYSGDIGGRFEVQKPEETAEEPTEEVKTDNMSTETTNATDGVPDDFEKKSGVKFSQFKTRDGKVTMEMENDTGLLISVFDEEAQKKVEEVAKSFDDNAEKNPSGALNSAQSADDHSLIAVYNEVSEGSFGEALIAQELRKRGYRVETDGVYNPDFVPPKAAETNESQQDEQKPSAYDAFKAKPIKDDSGNLVSPFDGEARNDYIQARLKELGTDGEHATDEQMKQIDGEIAEIEKPYNDAIAEQKKKDNANRLRQNNPFIKGSLKAFTNTQEIGKNGYIGALEHFGIYKIPVDWERTRRGGKVYFKNDPAADHIKRVLDGYGELRISKNGNVYLDGHRFMPKELVPLFGKKFSIGFNDNSINDYFRNVHADDDTVGKDLSVIDREIKSDYELYQKWRREKLLSGKQFKGMTSQKALQRIDEINNALEDSNVKNKGALKKELRLLEDWVGMRTEQIQDEMEEAFYGASEEQLASLPEFHKLNRELDMLNGDVPHTDPDVVFGDGEAYYLDELEALSKDKEDADKEYNEALVEVSRFSPDSKEIQSFSTSELNKLKSGDTIRFDHAGGNMEFLAFEDGYLIVAPFGEKDEGWSSNERGDLVYYKVNENGFSEVGGVYDERNEENTNDVQPSNEEGKGSKGEEVKRTRPNIPERGVGLARGGDDIRPEGSAKAVSGEVIKAGLDSKDTESPDRVSAEEAMKNGIVVSAIEPIAFREDDGESFPITSLIVKDSTDAARLFQHFYTTKGERAKVVYLGKNGEVLGLHIFSLGMPGHSDIDTEYILSNIPEGTVKVVIAHNHPSGNPSANSRDKNVNGKIRERLSEKNIDFNALVTDTNKYYDFEDGEIHEVEIAKGGGAIVESNDLPSVDGRGNFNNAAKLVASYLSSNRVPNQSWLVGLDANLRIVSVAMLPKDGDYGKVLEQMPNARTFAIGVGKEGFNGMALIAAMDKRLGKGRPLKHDADIYWLVNKDGIVDVKGEIGEQEQQDNMRKEVMRIVPKKEVNEVQAEEEPSAIKERREAFDKIANADGVKFVEINCLVIALGKTYPIKDSFKKLGFRFGEFQIPDVGKKKAWSIKFTDIPEKSKIIDTIARGKDEAKRVIDELDAERNKDKEKREEEKAKNAEEIKRAEIDSHVKTDEELKKEGESIDWDNLYEEKAQISDATRSRIDKVYAEWVEEDVPEWVNSLNENEAKGYAHLLEAAAAEDVNSDLKAFKRLEEFEKKHRTTYEAPIKAAEKAKVDAEAEAKRVENEKKRKEIADRIAHMTNPKFKDNAKMSMLAIEIGSSLRKGEVPKNAISMGKAMINGERGTMVQQWTDNSILGVVDSAAKRTLDNWVAMAAKNKNYELPHEGDVDKWVNPVRNTVGDKVADDLKTMFMRAINDIRSRRGETENPDFFWGVGGQGEFFRMYGEENAVNKRGKPVDSDTKQMTLFETKGIFTGSAADYEKPSLLKIGTGEGSQVYGHGLYGSDRRGVAETYAVGRQGDHTVVIVDGKEWIPSKDASLGEKTAYEQLDDLSNTPEEIAEYCENQDGDRYKDAAKFIRSHKIEIRNPHDYVYEQTFFTNRAPGDESHLLSWYEPVSSENMVRIKKQMEADGITASLWRNVSDNEDWVLEYEELGEKHRLSFGDSPKGDEVYTTIGNRVFGSAKKMSEFLARADIDGIKYPVDSYGGKTVKDGNKVGWNYVSFRDDNIRVDHKWRDGEQLFEEKVPVDKFDKAMEHGINIAYTFFRDKDIEDKSFEEFVKFADARTGSNPGARRFYGSWYTNAGISLTDDLTGKVDRNVDAKARKLVGLPVRGKDKPGARVPNVVQEYLIPSAPKRVDEKSYNGGLDADQQLGVNLALESISKPNGHFMLADGTGFGKTRQILAIADQYKRENPNARILICTKSGIIINDSFAKDAKSMGIDTSRFTIGTYPGVTSGKFDNVVWDLALLDEAHLLSNPESQRTRSYWRMKIQHKVFATATPMDRPTDATYFMAELGNISQEALANRLGYRIDVRVQEGREPYQVAVPFEGQDFDSIKRNVIIARDKAIASGKMIRRSYPFLGDIDMDYVLPMSDEFSQNEVEIIRYFDDEANSLKYKKKIWISAANGKGGKYYNKSDYSDKKNEWDAIVARARQQLQNQKYKALDKYNESAKANEIAKVAVKILNENPNARVIIVGSQIGNQVINGGFSGESQMKLVGLKSKPANNGIHYIVEPSLKVAERRLSALGFGNDIAHIYTGYNRTSEQNDFLSGKKRILVMTAQSGGTGVNLDDTTGEHPTVMLCLDKNYSAKELDQLLGRVSRKNTKSEARVLFITNSSVADAHKARVANQKIGILKAIQGGADMDVVGDMSNSKREEGEGDGDGELREEKKPFGVQKMAGVEYPDASEEINTLFEEKATFGKKRREEMKSLILKKRPDYGVLKGGLDENFDDDYSGQDKAVNSVIDEVGKFDTPKEQKAALHWFIKGAIRLPEDAPKVTEAIKYANESPKRVAGYREIIANFEKTMAAAKENLASQTDPIKVERAEQRIANAQDRYDEAVEKLPKSEGKSFEPLDYDSPMEMIEALHEFKPKAKPINPDKVPQLSDKRDMGYGVTTYRVQDDREGQQAMREIINTHWGEDANPWCLLHGDGYGNLSDGTNGGYDAWHYWNHYNALPKRVAFKDGKLLAFMATESVDTESEMPQDAYLTWLDDQGYSEDDAGNGEVPTFEEWYESYYIPDSPPEQWWDRKDASHEGIPLGNISVPGDAFGRWADFEIRDGEMKQIGGYQKGERGKDGFIEWYANGLKESQIVKADEEYYDWENNGDLYRAKVNGVQYNFEDGVLLSVHTKVNGKDVYINVDEELSPFDIEFGDEGNYSVGLDDDGNIAAYGESLDLEKKLQAEYDKLKPHIAEAERIYRENSYNLFNDELFEEKQAINEEMDVAGETPSMFFYHNDAVDSWRAEKGLEELADYAKVPMSELNRRVSRLMSNQKEMEDNITAIELLPVGQTVSAEDQALVGIAMKRVADVYDGLFYDREAAKENGNDALADSLSAQMGAIRPTLDRLQRANKKIGNAAGRALQARQFGILSDYTLAAVEHRAREANGGRLLSDEQRNELERLVKEADRASILEDAEKMRQYEFYIDNAIRDVIASAQKEAQAKSLTAKGEKQIMNEYSAALIALKFHGQTSGGLLIGLPRGKKWLDALQRYHLMNGEGLTDGDVDEKKMVDLIIEDCKAQGVEANEWMVRQMLSQMGLSTTPPKSQLEIYRRKLNTLHLIEQQMAYIVKYGELPPATGFRHDEPDLLIREARKRRAQLIKDKGLDAKDQDGKLKSAIDTIKTRLRNRIEELENAIRTGKKIEKGEKREYSDAEIVALHAQLKDAKERYDAAFPKTSDELLEAQMLRVIRALSNSKKRWTDILNEYRGGNFDNASPEKIPSNDPRVLELQKEIDDIKRECKELKDAAYPDGIPGEQQKRENRRLADIQKEIDELNKKIASYDSATTFDEKRKALEKAPRKDPFMTDAIASRIAKRKELRDKIDSYIAEIAQQDKGALNKSLDILDTLLNVSTRVLRTIWDFSQVLSQGAIATARLSVTHPKAVGKALVDTFNAFWSKEKSDYINEMLANDIYFQDFKKMGGRVYGSVDKADPFRGSERKIGKFSIDMIPFVKQSERSFGTYLNAMNVSLYRAMVEGGMWDVGGPTETQRKQLADIVSNATGSSGKKDGSNFGKVASLLLFAPRYALSTLKIATGYNIISPFLVWRNDNGYSNYTLKQRMGVSAEAVKTFVPTMVGIAAFQALINYLFNPDDEDRKWVDFFDVRSSDFLAARIGNSRINVLKPVTIWWTTMARLFGTASHYGVETDKDFNAVFGSLLRGKLSPIAGLFVDVATGKDMVGNKIDWSKFSMQKDGERSVSGLFHLAESLGIPMSMVDIYDIAKNDGILTVSILAPFSLLGARISSYNDEYERTAGAASKMLSQYKTKINSFNNSQNMLKSNSGMTKEEREIVNNSLKSELDEAQKFYAEHKDDISVATDLEQMKHFEKLRSLENEERKYRKIGMTDSADQRLQERLNLQQGIINAYRDLKAKKKGK